MEVGDEDRVWYADLEKGERVELEVGGEDQWCKYLGETGCLEVKADKECERVKREGVRVGRWVSRARLYGAGKLLVMDSVWGAMARYALKHVTVTRKQLESVEKVVRPVEKRALNMGVATANRVIEGCPSMCMMGRVGFANTLMIEKFMVVVRVMGEEGGGGS